VCLIVTVCFIVIGLEGHLRREGEEKWYVCSVAVTFDLHHYITHRYVGTLFNFDDKCACADVIYFVWY